jgi:hypothetical protein
MYIIVSFVRRQIDLLSHLDGLPIVEQYRAAFFPFHFFEEVLPVGQLVFVLSSIWPKSNLSRQITLKDICLPADCKSPRQTVKKKSFSYSDAQI